MKRLLLAVLALLALCSPADAGRWVSTELKWQNTTQGRPTLLSGLWPASLTSIYTRDSLWANIDSVLTGNVSGSAAGSSTADTTWWFNLREADPAQLVASTSSDSILLGYITLWMDSAAAPSPNTATALVARVIVANPGSNFRQDTTGAKQILHTTRATGAGTQTVTFTAGATNIVIPICLPSRGPSGANAPVLTAVGLAGQMALEISNLVPSAVGGGAEVTYNRLPRVRAILTYFDADE